METVKKQKYNLVPKESLWSLPTNLNINQASISSMRVSLKELSAKINFHYTHILPLPTLYIDKLVIVDCGGGGEGFRQYYRPLKEKL